MSMLPYYPIALLRPWCIYFYSFFASPASIYRVTVVGTSYRTAALATAKRPAAWMV